MHHQTLYCQTWESKLLVLNNLCLTSLSDLKSHLTSLLRLPSPAFLKLVQANKTILDLSQLRSDYTLHVTLASGLQGGKGGFGSLLRSMNPKKK